MPNTEIVANSLNIGIPIEELTSANPILSKNSMCVVKITDDSDNSVFKLKMGDGITAFNDLPYLSAESDTTKADLTYVNNIMSELNSTIANLIEDN